MAFPILDPLIGPLSHVIDRVLPDPQARQRAQAELLQLQGSIEMEALRTSLSAVLAEAQAADPWTSRARPAFLYVMYLMILCSVPMGLIASVSPGTASAIANGMTAYLSALPEPLYALFGTGYLGYATLRQWGKVKGADR